MVASNELFCHIKLRQIQEDIGSNATLGHLLLFTAGGLPQAQSKLTKAQTLSKSKYSLIYIGFLPKFQSEAVLVPSLQVRLHEVVIKHISLGRRLSCGGKLRYLERDLEIAWQEYKPEMVCG